MNQLDGLRKISTIVADTSDIQTIRLYNIQHATTNPSIILNTPLLTTYHTLFEDALIYAKKHGGSNTEKVTNASDRLIVNIGTEILSNLTGTVSTEIDAALSFDTDRTIKKAQKIINMYREKNIDSDRVLIKIAATWEGIKAAEILEKDGVKCNLTLIFSFAQARACAESNVYLISPFIGRIYDWYIQHNLLSKYCIDNDPGIHALKKIFYYYKQHHYDTIIMGASFRSIEQILSISGCDYLTITPNLLNQLYKNKKIVNRCLYPVSNINKNRPSPMSKSDFFLEHNQNKMAVEKLNEGIYLFFKDQQKLHNIITKQL